MFLKISALRRPARLRDDERGSLTVFALMFTVLLLGFAGFAVDVMRVEARRAGLQGALDSALLAAADVDQKGNPKSVVKDYMAKAGYAKELVGDPIVTDDVNGRTVSASVSQTTSPMFHLYQQDFVFETSAGATNSAPNLEVSLVVDISGSMSSVVTQRTYTPTNCRIVRDWYWGDYEVCDWIVTPAVTRMDELKKGAKSFVDTLLGDGDKTTVSVSVVPFSSSVNIGDDLYKALQLNSYSTDSDHCVRLATRDFSSVPLPSSGSWYYSGYENRTCPSNSYESIYPISRDPDKIMAQIKQFQPRNGTAIDEGIKWGAALLDPDIRPAIGRLVSDDKVEDIFKTRPYDYNAPGANKVLVVMSDGENSWSQNNTNMSNICTAAKIKGIIVYTVAVEMTTNGASYLRSCASTPAHFYSVGASEINEAFSSIATHSMNLRLIQ